MYMDIEKKDYKKLFLVCRYNYVIDCFIFISIKMYFGFLLWNVIYEYKDCNMKFFFFVIFLIIKYRLY